jgi:uncharacterized membrane protein (DUF106 family)
MKTKLYFGLFILWTCLVSYLTYDYSNAKSLAKENKKLNEKIVTLEDNEEKLNKFIQKQNKEYQINLSKASKAKCGNTEALQTEAEKIRSLVIQLIEEDQ